MTVSLALLTAFCYHCNKSNQTFELLSLVCTRSKITGYMGFFSSPIIYIQLCLQVPVCAAILYSLCASFTCGFVYGLLYVLQFWLTAACLVCLSNFLSFVLLSYCFTHNSDNAQATLYLTYKAILDCHLALQRIYIEHIYYCVLSLLSIYRVVSSLTDDMLKAYLLWYSILP